MSLPRHLVDCQAEIKSYAMSYGLDFFETIFEMVDFDQMNLLVVERGRLQKHRVQTRHRNVRVRVDARKD